MKILVDNGHGVNTPGKRSPDGSLREYKWNREVSSLIVATLKVRGYDAELLVPEDNDISLGERVRRANRYCHELGKDNVILLSIHVNAAGNGQEWMKGRGWSAYTTKGETASDRLATCLYQSVEKALPGQKIRKDVSDGDDDWEENFYILRKTLCVAVLTENFFMDNHEDMNFIKNEYTKRTIAKAHVEGIIEYIKTR